MRLPWYDILLWVAGPFVNAVLLTVLFLRRRLRHFSSLALWAAFNILSSLALSWAFRVNLDVYKRLYWSAEAIDFLLQLLIVAQVAWLVFRPLRETLRARWKREAGIAAGITLVALLLSISVHPAADNLRGMLEIRAQLFTSILICCVFTYVLVVSQRLALYWRSHVMTVGYGLTAWALVCLVIDLLHVCLGRNGHYLALEHARMLAYLCIFLYWIVALWKNEPEMVHLPSHAQKAILHAADRVSYDLAQVLGSRSPGQKKEDT